jgi:uncharacterized membrane protein HdeD (DUF308 family)
MPVEPSVFATRPMLRVLGRNWWLLLLRGIFAILFGIMAFAWPGLTLVTLVILFGIYSLLDGLLSLGAAAAGKRESGPLWWLIIGGLVSLAAAAACFFYPQITALVLVIFIGAWALVRGLFEIAGAMYLRKEIDNEWLLIAAGLLSVIFGIAILMAPGAGALALVWLIGAYALLFGGTLVWLALRLRKHGGSDAAA